MTDRVSKPQAPDTAMATTVATSPAAEENGLFEAKWSEFVAHPLFGRASQAGLRLQCWHVFGILNS